MLIYVEEFDTEKKFLNESEILRFYFKVNLILNFLCFLNLNRNFKIIKNIFPVSKPIIQKAFYWKNTIVHKITKVALFTAKNPHVYTSYAYKITKKNFDILLHIFLYIFGTK